MKKIYDLIVAGAGPSGVNAALSAARLGLSVLLVEKNGYPGGANTASMVCPLMTFHAGDRQVVRGIAQEVVDALALRGGTLGHIPDPIGMVSTITPIDPAILKLVYFELLSREKNITCLFYSFIESLEQENDKVTSIAVVNKNGKAVYQAKVFIDATGDGDLAYMSGVECVKGRTRDGLAQPMTLMFTIGGIRREETLAYIRKNPEQFIMDQRCDLEKYLAVSGFFSIVNQAQEAGDLTVPRDRVLFFEGVHQGEVLVNMTRVTKLSGVNTQDLTRAEFEAHRQVDEITAFFRRYLPGFQQCYLREVASSVGVRESRRVVGMETLETANVVHYLSHPNAVAVCAFPIDIHDPAGTELRWMRREKFGCYDIPYGVMVPKRIKNLLVTGRCISATHEALASARISVTAMALGEAGGVAAYLAVTDNLDLAKVQPAQIQAQLLEQNAIPGKKWV